MTIELTTAFDPGDIAEGSYTHVKVISFVVDIRRKAIMIDTLYGVESGGEFTDGVEVPRSTRKRFKITGNDFDAMVSKLTSAADVLIYDEVARELYQWLLDKGHFAGSII